MKTAKSVVEIMAWMEENGGKPDAEGSFHGPDWSFDRRLWMECGKPLEDTWGWHPEWWTEEVKVGNFVKVWASDREPKNAYYGYVQKIDKDGWICILGSSWSHARLVTPEEIFGETVKKCLTKLRK